MTHRLLSCDKVDAASGGCALSATAANAPLWDKAAACGEIESAQLDNKCLASLNVDFLVHRIPVRRCINEPWGWSGIEPEQGLWTSVVSPRN